MASAVTATFDKAWRAGIDLSDVGHPRTGALASLEQAVVRRLPASMKRPRDLVEMVLTASRQQIPRIRQDYSKLNRNYETAHIRCFRDECEGVAANLQRNETHGSVHQIPQSISLSSYRKAASMAVAATKTCALSRQGKELCIEFERKCRSYEWSKAAAAASSLAQSRTFHAQL